MFTRAREHEGFGLIELLVALTVLSIGILATIGVFASGMVTIRRAGAISTATALADRQMEGFRALRFASIGLLSPIPTNSVYTGDVAYTEAGGAAGMLTVASCSPTSQCTASQTLTGADGHSYRVDTYISNDVESGRTLKKVTIVVRNVKNLTGPTYVREVTSFDAGLG